MIGITTYRIAWVSSQQSINFLEIVKTFPRSNIVTEGKNREHLPKQNYYLRPKALFKPRGARSSKKAQENTSFKKKLVRLKITSVLLQGYINESGMNKSKIINLKIAAFTTKISLYYYFEPLDYCFEHRGQRKEKIDGFKQKKFETQCSRATKSNIHNKNITLPMSHWKK